VNRETGPICVTTIYPQEGKALTRIFDSKTLDSFVAAFPLSEIGGRLCVVWIRGSAYHFCAYALIGGDVRQVFDAASKGMPEFVIDFVIDQTENESILVTIKRFG
jgi:hypothetical protein